MRIGGLGLFGALARPLVRPLFRGLGIAASGLSAQRQRIDVIATNVANAETTRTPEGGPYQRRMVQMAPRGFTTLPGELVPGFLEPGKIPAGELPLPWQEEGAGVGVTGVYEDPSEGPLVYDPSHPDANEDGYVRLPNVNLNDEMVDLMEARRHYEANATVFQAMKNMLQRATEI